MGAKSLTAMIKQFDQASMQGKKSDVNLHVERRIDPRLPLLDGSLPGDLRVVGTRQAIEAGAVNVSIKGLCVWLTQPVMPGGFLELVLPEPVRIIPLSIVYCRPDPDDKNGRYLCGLKLLPSRVENLVEIFMRFGCIDEQD